MSLFRSTLSNPVSSAVDAFSKMTDTLNRAEDAPIKRRLMEEEVRDREAQRKRAEGDQKWQDEERDRQRHHWNQEDEMLMQWKRITGELNPAIEKSQAAIKEGKEPNFTQTDTEVISDAMAASPHIKHDDVDIKVRALEQIQSGSAKLIPMLIQKDKSVITRDQLPEYFDSWDKYLGDAINTGGDAFGNTVEQHGTKKRVSKIYFDKNTMQMTAELEVTSPVRDGQVMDHIGDKNPKYTVNSEAVGMVEPGNIDLSQRKVRGNEDGSISTVRSKSFNIDGKEVLLPTISDTGKLLTDKEAVAEYKKTGKHLGKFDSPEHADLYAEQLHSDPIWNEDKKKYSAVGKKERVYSAPMTFDQGTNPNAPVVQMDARFLGKKVEADHTLGVAFQQLKAQIAATQGPAGMERFMKDMETRQRNAELNRAVSQTLKAMDPKKSVNEQRSQFISEVTRRAPEADPETVRKYASEFISEKQPRAYQKADLALMAAGGDETAKRALGLLKDEDKDTEATLALKAARGDKEAKQALGFIAETKRESKIVTDPTAVVTDKDGNIVIVDKRTGATKKAVDSSGAPVKKGGTAKLNTTQKQQIGLLKGEIKKDIDKATEDDEKEMLEKELTDATKYIEDHPEATAGKARKEVSTTPHGEEKIAHDKAVRSMVRMLTGKNSKTATKVDYEEKTPEWVVSDFRAKGHTDEAIIKLGKEAGFDLTDTIKKNPKKGTNEDTKKTAPRQLSDNVRKTEGKTLKPLDLPTATEYARKAGWNGKGRPTQAQKDKAAKMAKEDGYEVK